MIKIVSWTNRGKEQCIINPTTGIIKCQTTEQIINDGKRYDKECKINSTLRQNDIRGKSTSYYIPDIKSEETITRFQYRSIPEL